MKLRIRRVRRKFRVEQDFGRGQVIALESFGTRRAADDYLAEVRRKASAENDEAWW